MLETLLHLNTSFAANDASPMFGAMFGGIYLLFWLVAFLVIMYPFYVIGTRLGHATPWFAFIPILNIVLLVQLAELEIWWVIVCILCGPVYIWPVMKICEKVGKPSWIGILMLVPCVNVFVPYYIAFG
jgi:hypothetical protein